MGRVPIKTTEEIELMRQTCKLASSTLDFISKEVKEGVSTLKLNDLCHEYIMDHGAYPAPLNYHGFPKSVCTSLNEVICHGIPSDKDVLKSGDILNIDVTTKLNGYHGDTNRTFLIGEVKPEVKRLVDITKQSLENAIAIVKPGARLGDIGHCIESFAHENDFTVVHEYCGHGIGKEFHEEPQVLHYGRANTGIELKEGMTFTIEPMVNLGQRYSKLLKDGWTVVTKDRKPSAQFEHTILVTKEGAEVLT